jgi:hypothetical protein
MFHDESTQVVRRNKGRRVTNSEPADTVDIGATSSEQTAAQETPSLPIKLTDFVMYQPLDELGISYFMATYVGEDPAVSQLYYLPDFYAKIGYANPGLKQCITAAGLAGYAKTARRRDLVDAATKSYVSAIRGINIALSDPKTASQDSTLMSIIMAIMYEVLIIPRIAGMQNCSKHINGAVSVALMNSGKGKQTDIKRKLLTSLVQSVILNCWIQHAPLPDNFGQLKKQVGNRINPDSVHGNFLDIILELVEFRQSLQNESHRRPIAIVKQALAIDDSLRRFSQTMPEDGRFKAFRVIHQGIEHLAFNGYFHGMLSTLLPYTVMTLLTSLSLSTAFYSSSMEQCPLISLASPSIDITTMSRNHNFIARGRLRLPECSESSIGSSKYRACDRNISYRSPACRLPRTTPAP